MARALVVECGQHFLRTTSALAIEVALDFLAHFGLIDSASRSLPAAGTLQPQPQRRFGLLRTHVIKTPEFRFTRPLVGFESFDEGELIATDGAEEIRAPCKACTVLMPARTVIVGREGLYLTQPID